MSRRELRALILAACAPVPAALLGIVLARIHGVGVSACALQIAALVLGFAAVALLARASPERVVARIPIAAPFGLALTAATLFVPGLDTVHRWLPVGPLRLHASEVLAPVVLLGAAALSAKQPWKALALLTAFQALHVAQPDAGQATAFATGVLALSQSWPLPRKTSSLALRLIPTLSTLVSMGLAAAAWKRPDPLLAVPHVEGIVDLAAQHGTVAKTAALVFLALALCPALIVLLRAWPRPPARTAALVLAAYSLTTGVVPWLGNYPVPILGFGASPILGAYLALGLLWNVARADAPDQESPGSGRAERESPTSGAPGTKKTASKAETDTDTSTDTESDAGSPSEPVVMPIEGSIDLHHFAPRDIPSVIVEYLYEAQKAGFREVRVIHGKGKGVQRRKAHLLLQNHPAVESFRSDGLGSTLARLRKPTKGRTAGDQEP